MLLPPELPGGGGGRGAGAASGWVRAVRKMFGAKDAVAGHQLGGRGGFAGRARRAVRTSMRTATR